MMKRFFFVCMILFTPFRFFAHSSTDYIPKYGNNNYPQITGHTSTSYQKNNGNVLLQALKKIAEPAAVLAFLVCCAYEWWKGEKELKDPYKEDRHYDKELRNRLEREYPKLLALAHTSNYDSVPPHVIKQRLNSVIVHTNNHATYEISTKVFALSAPIQQLLCEHNLPVNAYQTLRGSTLQHTIHTECLQVIDSIAGTSITQTNNFLMSFVELSRQHNYAGMVTDALNLLDVCWSFMRSATLAIGEGILEEINATATAIAHAITNPQGAVIELVTSARDMTYCALHAIKKYPALFSVVVLPGHEPLLAAGELVHFGNSFRHYSINHSEELLEIAASTQHTLNNYKRPSPAFAQSIENTAHYLIRFIKQHQSLTAILQENYRKQALTLTQEVGRTAHALQLYCVNNPYDALKKSSRLVTQTVLLPVTAHCLHKLFTAAYHNIPAYVEKIKQGSRALTAQEVPVAVALQTTEIITPAALQEEFVVLANTVQEETAAGSLVNVIPLVEDLVTNLTALLEPVGKKLPQLKQSFDITRKGFLESATKYIKVDHYHILGIGWVKKGKEIIKWFGFHHDFMGTIEKSGLVKFTNKVIHGNGFYKADVIINGIQRPKTFFPQHWSHEKVISKILEAYDHFIKNGAKNYELGKDGKYFVTGFIDEGVKIEMYITKKGQIVSAYPVLM